jgi:hypothetical protein
MHNNTTKNICLSLSLNYSVDFLKPFLKSFEKYSTGELHLITDIPNCFKQYKKVVPFDIKTLLLKHSIPTNLTAFNYKPVLFYLYLKNLKNIEHVLISDTDVIFQDDPFKVCKELVNTENDFVVCEEKKTFADCDVNTTWLRVSYPELSNELTPLKILNSGVIYGHKNVLQDYFKKMAYEMQNILPKCNYPILDQIILNVLYYKHKTITPKLLSHGNNFFVHLSQVSDTELTEKNIQNDIFTFNGNTPAIIHQYNKKPLLNNFYTKLYS